jgi:hypothetical protein
VLTIAGSEKLLRVGLASIALATEGFRHSKLDLQVLAVNMAVLSQSHLFFKTNG